jgi:glycosyltransferase involved in cell wall biosynthesis
MISCIMPTRGDLLAARFAIECFLAQSYPAKELVVVCSKAASEVERHIGALSNERIRFIQAPDAATVGDLRNRAIAHTVGDFLAVWDDDDLYHPDRLMMQMMALQTMRATAGVLRREILWWPAERRLAVSQGGIWENSMLARRSDVPPYPSLSREEDTAVIKQVLLNTRFADIDLPFLYVRIYHGRNIWDADHFRRFFDLASVPHERSAYEARLAELSALMPMREYGEALAASA